MDPALGFRDDLRGRARPPRQSSATARTPAAAPFACRCARGVDVIKIATTGGVNSRIGAGLGAQMFEDEARAIVETARLYGKKVAVHAHGADGVKIALAAGVDSIEHGTTLDEECLELFRRSGAYYVPTLSTVNGYLERIAADPNAYAPALRTKVDLAHPDHRRVTAQGGAARREDRLRHGRRRQQARPQCGRVRADGQVRHDAVQALEAATVNAADLLGLSADVGTLEPGKRADLIAVEGDPLAGRHGAQAGPFVMKDGAVFKDVRSTPRP